MENKKIPAKNYRDLIVWQEAIKLAKAIYKLTENFLVRKPMRLLK